MTHGSVELHAHLKMISFCMSAMCCFNVCYILL
uniref:Uncharacterized protein n=1 Tax=Anguilla anguilla TaxID=7936 RepID=A0A0E9SSW3_ANGAN